MATLSEKEMELLGSALSSIKGGKAAFMKSIDFDQVLENTTYLTIGSTKNMFNRLFEKLSGKAGSSKSKSKPSSSKPEGVTKNKTLSKGGRGRKKQPVSDEFASDAAEEDPAQNAGSEKVEDSDVEIVINKEIDDEGEPAVKHETSDADDTEVKDEQEE